MIYKLILIQIIYAIQMKLIYEFPYITVFLENPLPNDQHTDRKLAMSASEDVTESMRLVFASLST